MKVALLFIGLASAALVGCSAGTPGTTVSCDHGTKDLCTQTVSSTKHSPSTLEADCTAAGGAVTPGCSAGGLAGTCEGAIVDDTTASIYYYQPTFDATSGEADCTAKSGAFTAR